MFGPTAIAKQHGSRPQPKLLLDLHDIMRNLTLSASETVLLPDPDVTISYTTFDLDESVLYLASETLDDLQVHIAIWKTVFLTRNDSGKPVSRLEHLWTWN